MEEKIKNWNAENSEYKIVRKKTNTIKTILSVLGIIFLIIILFGAFVYSMYPEEVTESAKNRIITIKIQHEISEESLDLIYDYFKQVWEETK
jgi:predicted PurR-regulated permease PerM